MPISSSSESIKDYVRYQRLRHPSPQVVNSHTTPQPDRVIEEPQNVQFDNWVHQPSEDSGSDSEHETWSFDKSVNEV